MTLPLPLRNRLAELIVESLHDPSARRGLEAIAAIRGDPGAAEGGAVLPDRFPADLFERRGGDLRLRRAFARHEAEFCGRAARAWSVLAHRPLDPPDPPLATALAAAAALFDARLYFEVHEHLEPYWVRADGLERQALQGLIQVAVGFQHLVNGNPRGAVALLGDGCEKTRGRSPAGLDLDPFAEAVGRCARAIAALGPGAVGDFDWNTVPSFPRAVA